MSKTLRAPTMHPISLRRARVLRVADLSPAMRRVTFGGDELGPFVSANGFDQPAFFSDSFDDEIRLIFAEPGRNDLLLPIQTDGSLQLPDQGRVLSRPYTVRRWDPEARELDVDFVRHGTGVATTWAMRAQPGEHLHLFGPLITHEPPAADRWLLLAGDETALPAIGRLLEELAPAARGLVFIELSHLDHRLQLRDLPGVEVTWLVRTDEAADSPLLDAVRAKQWPEGTPFTWLAGEQSLVRDLRRHLVNERGMSKSEVEFTGYWKRRPVATLADDVALPDPEQDVEPEDRFHELTESVPPLAIRAAVDLDLGELIASGVTSAADLAKRSGCDERALGKLLRYLHAIEILTLAPDGGYRLTDVGEFLTDDDWNRALRSDGAQAQQQAGITGLLESVRTGRAAYAAVTGRSFAELRTEPASARPLLAAADEEATLLASALVGDQVFAGVEHLVIHAPGAAAYARQLAAAHPEVRISICALPAQVDWLYRTLPSSLVSPHHDRRVSVVTQSIFETSPTADAVLLAGALGAHPDADAAHALRRAAENLSPAGAVHVVESLFEDETVVEHAAERDLFALTRDGTGLRTGTEWRQVMARAGLALDVRRSVGWGATHFRLIPEARG